eukprot:6380496-Heterocapsa_arctica.AAC.1
MAPGGGHCPSLDPFPGHTCGKWARRPGMPSIPGPQIGAPQRRWKRGWSQEGLRTYKLLALRGPILSG